MACGLVGAKPLSEPIMVSLLTHVCVIRPQWVNHTGQDLVSLIVLNLTSLTSADSGVINNTEPHVINSIEPGVIYITELDGINGDVPEVIKILNLVEMKPVWDDLWPPWYFDHWVKIS